MKTMLPILWIAIAALSGCVGDGLNPGSPAPGVSTGNPGGGSGGGPTLFTVTALASDGEETINLSSATIAPGDTQAFSVTPATGYLLLSAVGGTCPAGAWSGSAYTTGVITEDCTVSFGAVLSASAVTLTVSGDAHESVTPAASPLTLVIGETQAFTVTANAGYSLESVGGTCPAGSWSGNVYTTGALTANCAVTFAAATSVYTLSASGDGNETFSPTASRTIAAGATQSYTVSANTGDTLVTTVGGTCPQGSWSGSVYTTGAITGNCGVSFSAVPTANIVTVTPSGDGHETITQSSAQNLDFGGSQSFTVTPAAGYAVLTAVGGNCNAGAWSGSVYTLTNVTGNCAISFSAATSSSTHTITVSADGNETISPSVSTMVVSNTGSTSLTINANPGYTLSSVTGCAVSNSGATYTVSGSSNCTLTVVAGVSTFTVAESIGAGVASISPSSTQTVNNNGTVTYTLAASGGYTLSTSVGGGGSGVAACPRGAWASATSYTTGPITANCSLSFSAATTEYTIAVTSDGNETVSPSAPSNSYTVASGGTHAFTVTPTSGDAVTVVGTCPAGSWNGTTYTTGTVSGNCTLTFTAAAATPVEITSDYTFMGIVNDGSTFGGSSGSMSGVDGDGNSFSSSCLASSFNASGTSFAVGPAMALDMFKSSSGITIALPTNQHFSYVRMIATGTNGGTTGQSGTFTLTYTDNSTDSITQSFSDWALPPNCGGGQAPTHNPGNEAVAGSCPYRDTYAGGRNVSYTQDNGCNYNVYEYSFAIDNTKYLSTLLTPGNVNIIILAITLVP